MAENGKWTGSETDVKPMWTQCEPNVNPMWTQLVISLKKVAMTKKMIMEYYSFGAQTLEIH